MAQPDFLAILRLFSDHDVEALVVGGIAAVIHGAPVFTEDLDLVYRNSAENVGKIQDILSVIDATYRDPAGRKIGTSVSGLQERAVDLLRTRFGALDLLQEIGNGRRYEQLLSSAKETWFDDFSVQVLDLENLIVSKQEAGRPKDHRMLPILLELLERQSQQDTESKV